MVVGTWSGSYLPWIVTLCLCNSAQGQDCSSPTSLSRSNLRGYLKPTFSVAYAFCDSQLPKTWYRATVSGTEYDLAMTCPRRNHCGTVDPIWMNGTVPAQRDGVVGRQACVVNVTSCCSATIAIRVYNCGSFRLYWLPPSPACNQAYCLEPAKTSDDNDTSSSSTVATTPSNTERSSTSSTATTSTNTRSTEGAGSASVSSAANTPSPTTITAEEQPSSEGRSHGPSTSSRPAPPGTASPSPGPAVAAPQSGSLTAILVTAAVAGSLAMLVIVLAVIVSRRQCAGCGWPDVRAGQETETSCRVDDYTSTVPTSERPYQSLPFRDLPQAPRAAEGEEEIYSEIPADADHKMDDHTDSTYLTLKASSLPDSGHVAGFGNAAYDASDYDDFVALS